MNESGLPVTPPVDPPSYLRRPSLPYPDWPRSSTLLLVMGIAAITIIVWGYVNFGSASPSLEGSLIVYATEPTPGAYVYTLSTKQTLPLPFSQSSQSGGVVTAVAFSPGGERYINIVSTSTSELISTGEISNETPEVITNARVGTPFISPVISQDGAMAAFFVSFAFPSSAHKGVNYKAILSQPVSITPHVGPNVIIATRGEQGSYELRYSSSYFKPLAFSYDNAGLLMRGDTALGIMNFGDQKINQLSIPLTASSSVALAPDHVTLAASYIDGVHFGTIHWKNKTYEERGVIKTKADHVLFTRTSDLLIVSEGMVSLYELNGTKARLRSSAKISLPPSSTPLLWLTEV